jgi:hypothetical protein
MSSAGWALQKAMYARLSADAALGAVIGTPARLYDGAPPARAAYPFALFADAREKRIAGADRLLEHEISITVWSKLEGRREVKDAITAIVSALDEAALALDGFRLVGMRAVFTDIFLRPESDAVQGLIRLRAVTERLS